MPGGESLGSRTRRRQCLSLPGLGRLQTEKRLWSMEDVVALIDEHAPKLADRLVG
jgi:hypothetical protein